jgi:hypothetical protein
MVEARRAARDDIAKAEILERVRWLEDDPAAVPTFALLANRVLDIAPAD